MHHGERWFAQRKTRTTRTVLNMKKLATVTAVAAAAWTALVFQANAASTNIVQGIAFQLTFLEQGPTNHPNANLTVVTVDKGKVTTKDIIAALGTATGNSFSSGARLV